MKRYISLLCFVLFLGACATKDPVLEALNPDSIAGKVYREPDLKRLTQAFKTADLLDLFDDLGVGAEYTMFAPSDAAFSSVGALPKDADLQRLLYYHVVNGILDEATLKAGGSQMLETVEGNTLNITIENDIVRVNGGAVIIRGDIRAANGIVHVIDTVLTVPPATR